MPLLHSRLLNHDTLLGIWHLTEQPQELLAGLPPQLSTAALTEKTHPRRQREWLASRTLLYRLLPHFTTEPLRLICDENGKPMFEDTTLQLSISHSPELAAVIISRKHNVGIDIELINPKALRVADKFLTDTEKQFTAGNELKTCLYWSAKETLYKLYSKRKLLFKENIALMPAADYIAGSIRTTDFRGDYKIYHEVTRNHVLTYSIDETDENYFL